MASATIPIASKDLQQTDSTDVSISKTKDGQLEGPPGCNLIVNFLPRYFGDNELVTTFAPYGTLISAHVFIDKTTGQSKCYGNCDVILLTVAGFVSYNNPESAQRAITTLNGIHVDKTRLKVKLKRQRAQPY